MSSCGSHPAVVPVALPGPAEPNLSQVNKSFWHYKIFRGAWGSGKAISKNFLPFRSVPHTLPPEPLPSRAEACTCMHARGRPGVERISSVTLIVWNYTCISVASIWGLCIPLGPSHCLPPPSVMAFKTTPFQQSYF